MLMYDVCSDFFILIYNILCLKAFFFRIYVIGSLSLCVFNWLFYMTLFFINILIIFFLFFNMWTVCILFLFFIYYIFFIDLITYFDTYSVSFLGFYLNINWLDLNIYYILNIVFVYVLIWFILFFYIHLSDSSFYKKTSEDSNNTEFDTSPTSSGGDGGDDGDDKKKNKDSFFNTIVISIFFVILISVPIYYYSDSIIDVFIASVIPDQPEESSFTPEQIHKAYCGLMSDLWNCIQPYIKPSLTSYILVPEYSDVNTFFISLENYITFCNKFNYVHKSHLSTLLSVLRYVEPTPNSIHYNTFKCYIEYLWLLYDGKTDPNINLSKFS